MRLRISVGSVMVDLQGVDLSTRAIRSLIDQCAEKNAAIPDEAAEAEPEKAPIGFAATVERADEHPLDTFDR